MISIMSAFWNLIYFAQYCPYETLYIIFSLHLVIKILNEIITWATYKSFLRRTFFISRLSHHEIRMLKRKHILDT